MARLLLTAIYLIFFALLNVYCTISVNINNT